MSAAPPPLSDAALQAILEGLPEAVLVAGPDGSVLAASRRAAELLGRDLPSLRGSALAALIPCDCVASLLHKFADGGPGDGAQWKGHACTFEGKRPDGASFSAEVQVVHGAGAPPALAVTLHAAPLARPGAGGQPAAAPAGEDMSARLLISAASHDLRQPLQTLRMLNGSLLDEVAAPQLRELVAQQQLTLESMGLVVDTLLDIGRIDAGMVHPEPRDVDLSALLAKLGREFEALSRHGGIALRIDAPRVGAHVDPVLLGQVLRNLVANAFKFTPRGEVRLSCLDDGERAVVEVGDDGIGIAPEHLGRIFDAFYRVPEPRAAAAEGHGLGLAIVRRLADLLGISLSVESTPGAGTRFRLSMPRARLPSADGAAGTRRQRPPAFAKAHRVLLLEDDPGLRQASTRWLAARGLDVAAASSGSEAMRIASGGFAPDLVICDLHLADGENGVEALQRLRAMSGRELPALVLSGDSSEAARAVARVEGVGMLLKPVDPDELLAAMRRLLDGPRS